MARETRVPRSQRPAPKYKSIETVIEEIISRHSTMSGMHAELKDRIVMVVRTDHEANRA